MPIKFRCTHCRQFLGISQSKAGEIVDCPTCGRTVRVPDLDGRVAPIPEPALNVADTSLADALEELALIGQTGQTITEYSNQPQALEPDRADSDVIAPLPAPTPISLDPPLPAEPVALTLPEPAANPLELGEGSRSAADLDWPDGPGRLGERAASGEPPSSKNDDPLLSLSQKSPEPNRRADSVPPRHRFTRRAVALIVLVGLTSFGLGYFVGRAGVKSADAPIQNNDALGAGNREQSSAADTSENANAPSLSGRITYRTEAGGNKPDRGAHILVFPHERPSGGRLSIVGFRPADTADDRQAATANLRALGGDLAVADADGRFDIFLPQAGEYHVLVLSHYHPRDEQTPIEPQLKTLLDNFFDRGNQLLGRVAFHFSQVRHQGAGTEPWDHTFR